MTFNRDIEYYISIVHELCKLPHETEWVEFKHNNEDPTDIGEYISALSNTAALNGKANAYMVWGIEDQTHNIIGTKFSPANKKVGGAELENWLLQLLNPKINFRFIEIPLDKKRLILLEISRAFRNPVQFKGVEYLRVGSYKKKLKDFPEKERELWRFFNDVPFEDHIAIEDITSDEITQLLDYPAYFDLLKLPLPGKDGIIAALASDSMIKKSNSGKWDILNLGAILLAKKLSDFRTLKRKAVRVVFYRGNNRVEPIREQVGTRGYASGFNGLINYITNMLPTNEVIETAVRKTVPMYPTLAVRELIANTIIHQDFFVTGAGPLIEIFENRMEITNPGKPLISVLRFIDIPPRSRNDVLASFMRRVGICEERGSGIDKVIIQTELYQLPAPLFEEVSDNTRVTLFAHKELKKMNKDDRIRACYQHACLRYINKDNMTNSSLRERFAIESKNSAIASRIIKETITIGLIKPYNENAGRKFMQYVPFWV